MRPAKPEEAKLRGYKWEIGALLFVTELSASIWKYQMDEPRVSAIDSPGDLLQGTPVIFLGKSTYYDRWKNWELYVLTPIGLGWIESIRVRPYRMSQAVFDRNLEEFRVPGAGPVRPPPEV